MARQLYRFLALDIDGTVTADGKTIEPRLARAAQRARSLGVIVTLATGRPYAACGAFIKGLAIDVPVVVHNGAVIIDPRTGGILSLTPIPKSKAFRVLELARRTRVHVFAREIGPSGENVLTEPFSRPPNPAEREYLEHNATPVKWTPRLEDGITGQIPKFLIMDDPEVIEGLASLLNLELGAAVNVYVYGTPHSSGIGGLEVFAGAVSKGAGVRAVAAALGVQPGEIIALGDDMNDEEMLAEVGLGVAMGSAPPNVRGAAAFVTGTASQGGAATAIVHFLLRSAGIFDNLKNS